MFFFFFASVLEHLFALFVSRRAASLLSLIPAALLLFLFQKADVSPYWTAALLTAAAARLFGDFLPRKEALFQALFLYSPFPMDAAAAALYFAKGSFRGHFATDKPFCVCLAILTLASAQALLSRKSADAASEDRTAPGAFPFHFFILLGTLLLLLPMRQQPIDWTPVVNAGAQLVRTVMDAAGDLSYRLSSLFGGDSYTAGYSTLDVTGQQLGSSNAAQLLLFTDEMPYHIYRDEETSMTMQVRRAVYLAGGRGADCGQLVRFLRFMHEVGADHDQAALFSRLSDIRVEYAYLDTADEIAPAGSISLTADSGQKIEGGRSTSRHKKGYSIRALYLDVDYGSPYLTGLIRQSLSSKDSKSGSISDPQVSVDTFSYEDACDTMRRLYGANLGSILTKEEYETLWDRGGESGESGYSGDGAALSGSASENALYTDTHGASGRMEELAARLTENTPNDYDKAKRIEKYLRQYTYSTDAVGGHDPRSDLRTPEGMSDIADRFLFETGSGYCVHYTSSMVILLRLAGIPSRAVSGYRYVFPFAQQEAYAVSGNCAHIWPEAYFDNIGWVPFEPTAVYRTASEFTWHRTAGNDDAGTPAGESDEDAQIPEQPDFTDTDSEETSSETSELLFTALARPMVLSIVLLLGALIAGTSLLRRARYRNASPEKRLVMDVEMIKKSIRRQYADAFNDRGLLSDYVNMAPEELRPDLEKVFGVCYRILYGGGADTAVTPDEKSSTPSVSAEESALAQRIRERLQEMQRSYKNQR